MTWTGSNPPQPKHRLVVSNLCVYHVADQPEAVSDIARVLRPGGRFAITVWRGPDQSPCFELVYGVVKHHGSPAVSAPPGLNFHQFATPVFAEQALANAGFADVACDVVDCAWGLDAPDGLVDIFAKCTVRAAMLLASQPVEAAAYRSRPGDRMAGGRRTSRR
jgi:SAM-dependent methyltransferase